MVIVPMCVNTESGGGNGHPRALLRRVKDASQRHEPQQVSAQA
jgi:hypothetical protein